MSMASTASARECLVNKIIDEVVEAVNKQMKEKRAREKEEERKGCIEEEEEEEIIGLREEEKEEEEEEIIDLREGEEEGESIGPCAPLTVCEEAGLSALYQESRKHEKYCSLVLGRVPTAEELFSIPRIQVKETSRAIPISPKRHLANSVEEEHNTVEAPFKKARVEDKDLCCICIVEKKDTACTPCGHKCMCYRCAVALQFKSWNTGCLLCPLCRKECIEFYKIYE